MGAGSIAAISQGPAELVAPSDVECSALHPASHVPSGRHTPSRDRRSPRLSQLLFCRDKVVAEFGLKVWRNLNVSIFQSSIYCHFAGKNIQWKSFMAKCKKKHHLSHGLIERVILSRK